MHNLCFFKVVHWSLQVVHAQDALLMHYFVFLEVVHRIFNTGVGLSTNALDTLLILETFINIVYLGYKKGKMAEKKIVQIFDSEEANISITVHYKQPPGTTGQNDFNNLQDLKKWLDKHPKLAEKLGYKKGGK